MLQRGLQWVRAFADRGSTGQGLAEYALILALIGIVAIVALLFLGGAISSTLHEVGSHCPFGPCAP
jgi:Flp pilus assembly pilin Flp